MTHAARGGVGVLLAVCAFAIAGCAPATKYVPPSPPVVTSFKENPDWKVAEPADAALRGAWWEVFGDEELNRLESVIDVSNQTLKEAEARFVEARAAVRGARAALAPQVSTAPSIERLQQSGNRAVASLHQSYGDFMLPASVAYEPDVWRRIRSSIEANRTLAQANAADLESTRLSLHAELAADYFALRGLDREQALLESTVASYERALELTQNRFTGGLASQADVALAETQLETTRAQAVDIGEARAGLEHAIAVLVGLPPSSFALAAAPQREAPPPIPVGVPSDLLERRPDVAAAERLVASASAQIGVAEAAFYPTFSLTGAGGFESTSLASWVTGMSTFWSTGPAAIFTVFDSGRRRAVSAQARAAYDQASAAYQQSVLVAFREVEDQLASLRILEQEAGIQQRAVDAAERSLQQATNRYRGGIVSYLEVTTAQSVALTNQRTAVGLLTRRMTASVLLIKALGGGWNVSSLPRVTDQR